MTRVQSFEPVAARDARVLILGSMPGTTSLARRQYYAHPRNAFWPILADVFGFSANDPYRRRMAALRASGVALWDVLQACRRPGSLDSAIDSRSVVANDFRGFYRRCPCIGAVFFNGAKAEQLYRRHVLATLDPPQRALVAIRLPSTSPANAGVAPGDKARAWWIVKTHAQP